MPTTQTYTPVTIQMSPEDLRQLIMNAMREGAETLREELRHRQDPQHRTISGRKEVMAYLGIRNSATLRQRIKDYPEAFTQEGRSTIILDTTIFNDLKRRAEKMRRK